MNRIDKMNNLHTFPIIDSSDVIARISTFKVNWLMKRLEWHLTRTFIYWLVKVSIQCCSIGHCQFQQHIPNSQYTEHFCTVKDVLCSCNHLGFTSIGTNKILSGIRIFCRRLWVSFGMVIGKVYHLQKVDSSARWVH